MARKRIGELLLDKGAISPAQLEAGLAAQRLSRLRLGVTLIQQGAITEDQLAKVLAEALHLPTVELGAIQPEGSAIHLLRARFCEQHELIPYALIGEGKGRKQVEVAMADPLNVAAIEEIEFTTGLKVLPRVAPHSAVRTAILRHYHRVRPEDSVGPVQIIQRGGVVVEMPRDNASPEEEEVLVGEMVADEAPGHEDDERSALAALIAAREAEKRRSRQGKPDGATSTSNLRAAVANDLDYLFGGTLDADPVEELERKFWALMRIMARKGLISREEFMSEVEGGPEKKKR